jgi:hypothetical protein
MALSDTKIRNAKPKDKPHKLADSVLRSQRSNAPFFLPINGSLIAPSQPPPTAVTARLLTGKARSKFTGG